MGIEGFLRRTTRETVSLIREEGKEKKFDALKSVLDEEIEWLEHMLLNQEGAEDEEEESNEQPDEQYFPTAYYDWVFPKEGDGLVPLRWVENPDIHDLFMNRAAIFAFVKLFQHGGMSLLAANKETVHRDGSLKSGIMMDYTPSGLAEQAIELGLLEISGPDEGGEVRFEPESKLALTNKGQDLIRDVTLRSDAAFFWNEEWPAVDDTASSPSAPSSAVPLPTEASPRLLDLPFSALGRILTRLDCASLCRMEMLCTQAHSALLIPCSVDAPPAGGPAPEVTSDIDRRVSTPLGLLAWFVCHRRAWGGVSCTTTLAAIGYRADAIRRHRRRRAVDVKLYGVGGLRLGAEWHYIHFAMGPEAGRLLLDNAEASPGLDMGGTGIPVLAHTPEEVAGLYRALRVRCCVDVHCECGGPLAPTRNMRDPELCPYHAEWESYGFWEYATKAQAAGVMGPRDLEDYDVGWMVRAEVLAFLRATVENGQGLVAYVW